MSSGLAQIMVFANGLILTVTAFFILSIFIKGISRDEYMRTSQEAGRVLVDGISGQENAMRLVSSIILLSKNTDKGILSEQIRRHVPGLGKFEQLIWLYETTAGTWQYKTIFESSRKKEQNQNFRLTPNKQIVTRMVTEKFFETDKLRVVSDFPGMDYIQTRDNPQTTERPFAFVKVITKGNSSDGILIAVSRPELVLDEGWMANKNSVSGLSIRDISADRALYSMTRKDLNENATINRQNYNFFVGDSEWQIILQFTREENVAFLEQVPYLILFFGISLTLIGTLFVRNNQKQSLRVSEMNRALEQKNYELESEIAERERLNKALIKADRDNRAIIDSVTDILFETDTTGNILFLSAAWRKITGFDQERSRGSDLFSMIHPEEQGKQRKDFELLVKGQKTAYRTFTRIRTSDGTFRAVELAVSMIRQDENKNLRVVGTITDVEERRRAERALAEAEKKYRTIVENAAGGLYQLTPEGMYLSANPSMARILGYASVEEMLRDVKNAIGSVYPNKEEREAFINALTRAGQINGYETQVLKKDKTKIWVSENVRIVKDESQNILYIEGSMEDITKRKVAESSLRDAKVRSDMANRAKTEFIANMSHELRTPLNAIIGFSEIMKNQIMGPLGHEMYADYVNDIHKSGKGLLKTINEILDISKIEAGNRELNESEFSAEQAIIACMELQATKVQDKKIIVTNNTKNLPNIIGEELAIKQVITNIYSNAIKFTPEAGRITLFSNFDHDGSFRLSISDTGIGLTRDEIQKALSPFGQIDNALDRSGSGVGLGLTLSQSIMQLHGGNLEILSEKGIGTTVSMIFPADRIGADSKITKPQKTNEKAEKTPYK